MAYPSDPRNPPEARGRLTPEEADRLAAMFRPSWEIDDAQAGPVQPGLGASPSTEVRPAQGDGARPDARAPAPAPVAALNGSHLVAPVPVVPQQPESSVVVDSSDILPSSRAGAPVPTTHTLVLPDPVGSAAFRGGPSAIPARTVPFAPAPRIATPLEMAEFVEPDFVKPAKRMGLGLWAGIGIAAAAVIGIGVWLGSSSDEKHTPAAPLPERVHVAPPPVPPPPPPPAETVASQPPAPVVPVVPAAPPPSPPPATPSPPVVAAPQPAIAAATPAPISNTTQPAAAAAAPPQKLFVPPAPQRPTWVPPPRPAVAPAQRPKPASPTIVRDAPF
jgi:hypothetical protein